MQGCEYVLFVAEKIAQSSRFISERAPGTRELIASAWRGVETRGSMEFEQFSPTVKFCSISEAASRA